MTTRTDPHADAIAQFLARKGATRIAAGVSALSAPLDTRMTPAETRQAQNVGELRVLRSVVDHLGRTWYTNEHGEVLGHDL